MGKRGQCRTQCALVGLMQNWRVDNAIAVSLACWQAESGTGHMASSSNLLASVNTFYKDSETQNGSMNLTSL